MTVLTGVLILAAVVIVASVAVLGAIAAAAEILPQRSSRSDEHSGATAPVRLSHPAATRPCLSGHGRSRSGYDVHVRTECPPGSG